MEPIHGIAPLKKFIDSMIDLRGILLGCNSRYLEFLSSLNDYANGRRALQQLTKTKAVHGIQVRGFNFFDTTEQDLLRAIQRPEFNIHGLRRGDLKKHLLLLYSLLVKFGQPVFIYAIKTYSYIACMPKFYEQTV